MNGKITPEETEKVINVTPETTEMNINTTQENSTFLVLDDEAYTSQMIEEYNQNARAKTEEFNTNAENKIAIYNSNAADRTTAFDNNYDNKIAAFNSNANKQTKEFDAHVLMQTNTFNNNATSAITNYNSNAAQKIDEFNQNASNFVNSLMVKKIEVVNELPETEEEGVLYLVKEVLEPVVVNLYPSQVENTETNGFTVTFKERNVIANGSNDGASVWGWTNHFNMNLEANKTYYLQFTNVSGSFDDSKRISQSDGIVNAVSLTGYDASSNSTNLINSVERTASGIYEKYTFTPTTTYSEYALSMQVKKLNVFTNWTCSIVIAEESV